MRRRILDPFRFPQLTKSEIISIHCSIRSTWSVASAGRSMMAATEQMSNHSVQFTLFGTILCSRLVKDIRTTHNSTSFAFILGLTFLFFFFGARKFIFLFSFLSQTVSEMYQLGSSFSLNA